MTPIAAESARGETKVARATHKIKREVPQSNALGP